MLEIPILGVGVEEGIDLRGGAGSQCEEPWGSRTPPPTLCSVLGPRRLRPDPTSTPTLLVLSWMSPSARRELLCPRWVLTVQTAVLQDRGTWGPASAKWYLAGTATGSSSTFYIFSDFPGGTRGREPACQCRRRKTPRFDPWVRKIPWRRQWQPAPVFLPGESHGQRSLVGYSPRGHKELDTTEWLSLWAKVPSCSDYLNAWF